jgi:hypothetical protein
MDHEMLEWIMTYCDLNGDAQVNICEAWECELAS